MSNLNKISNKNICLIGLMGSGKTMIGKNLSRVLKRKHIDTDKVIENRYKKTISNIFENHGETYFRQIEEKIVMEVLKKKNYVVSLGGGSILSKNVRELLKKKNITIYLKVKTSELEKRLANSKKRPLLAKNNLKDNLTKILESRKSFYKIADFIIQNNNDPNRAISDILDNLNKNE